jgi:gluconolactonase
MNIATYNPVISDYINTDATLLTLANDCEFTEGPVWNADGYYLFSDTTANVIYKISEGRKKEVFLSNAGTNNINDEDLKPGQAGSNALAYDANGELIVCQHGSHAIAKFDGHNLQPFISHYAGKPFNSPNDMILRSNGSLYFSDPPYGLKDAQINPEKYQPLAGVYCWKEGALQLICDKYQYPNGVCLSPDESFLYICSNKPFEKRISIYDTQMNSFVKVFAEETSDGIECDTYGNVYLCNKEGVIILDTEGSRLAMIELPTIPANICWGGAAGNDLFVTARENIFLLKNLRVR